jgi:hypothetical protein
MEEKRNYSFSSFTLENRRLGTVVGSMARSFEKESYLEEVNTYLKRILSLTEIFR